MRWDLRFRWDPVAAVGLLVMVVALIWGLAIQPLMRQYQTQQAALSSAETRIATLTSRISTLRDERDGVARIDVSRVQWRADQLGEASAQVQAKVTRLARDAGVNLRSITPIPSSTLAGEQAIAMRLEGEGDLERLSNLIQSLEAHQPLLVIDHSVMRRLNRPNSDARYPLVFFQLTVFAPVALPGEV